MKRRSRHIISVLIVIAVIFPSSEVISSHFIGGGFHSLDYANVSTYYNSVQSFTIISHGSKAQLNVYIKMPSVGTNNTPALLSTYVFYPNAGPVQLEFTKSNQTTKFPFNDLTFKFGIPVLKITNTSTGKSTFFSPTKLPKRSYYSHGLYFSRSIPGSGRYYYTSSGALLILDVLPSDSVVNNFTGMNLMNLKLNATPAPTITGYYIPSQSYTLNITTNLLIQRQNYSVA